MARKKDAKRRQKALQRKAARRKKKQSTRQVVPRSPRTLLRRASNWPLYECLVTKDWQKPEEIVQVLVARRSPTGQVACGVFLVDLGCLGVKNGFARLFDSSREYRQQLRKQIKQSQPMRKVDLDLAAKIIHEAIAYARSLGFSPHRDSRIAMPLLEGADPNACEIPVPLGDGTGKPFYVSGPRDNVPRIMAQLQRAVGPEGFDYLVHLQNDTELLEDVDFEDETG